MFFIFYPFVGLFCFTIFLTFSLTKNCFPDSVTSKKLPNVYKSFPKMISLKKLKILTPLQKLPKNVKETNCRLRLWKVTKIPINRPIWSHCFQIPWPRWRVTTANEESAPSTVWPDLAKFHHFGKKYAYLWQLLSIWIIIPPSLIHFSAMG